MALGLPVGGQLVEVDVLAHADVAHVAAVGRRFGDARQRQRHADPVHPGLVDLIGPDVARLVQLRPHLRGRGLDLA